MRVLVVDCDRATSSATEQLLAAAGYSSTSASSFEGAMRHVAVDRPDLVVAPIRLGRFNGLHLALRCRSFHPTLPIVVTAAADDAGLAAEAAEYGARFVPNTTDPRQFLEIITELLAPSPSEIPSMASARVR